MQDTCSRITSRSGSPFSQPGWQETGHPGEGFLRRAEILAALANGMTLVAISIWVFIEAFARLQEPPRYSALQCWPSLRSDSSWQAGAAILTEQGENLNVEEPCRHVLADALGSVGAMVAAAIIILTGWRYADPLVASPSGS